MGTFAVFLLTFVVVLLILLRLQAIRDQKFFETQGLLYLGNRNYAIFYQALKGITIPQCTQEWYNRMVKTNHRIAGSKEFGSLVVMINDPELVKQITVKDFSHFVNRREFEMPREEKIFSKMLFSLRGEKWKEFRSTVSPAFSSGKIKRLYSLFEKSGHDLVNFLDRQIDTSHENPPTVEVEFVDAFRKYTLEIIATAVCGLQSKAFETNEESQFENMAKRMELNFGGLQMIKLLVVLTLPKVANLLGLSFFDKEAQQYFTWAIKKTARLREASTRPHWNDFIQIMLETRKQARDNKEHPGKAGGGDKDVEDKADFFDDDHLAANCILFIMAGYDTTHSVLLFTFYSLALNPDIQNRLRKEIEKAVEDEANDGQQKEPCSFISYDKVHQLTYLDMVCSEVLRLYPPTVLVDRGCVKDFQFPGTDYVLKKGQGVMIPIFAFHRDERFFPDPLKFDPERFSAENKADINQYAYMPFGTGPRNCIGYRFALTEAKLAIALLVYHYQIEPSTNTTVPMVFKNYNTLKPKDGMKLNITKIPRIRNPMSSSTSTH